MALINNVLSNPYLLYPLIIWSVFWKGAALWRAARLTHLGWFVLLLVINTVGIFEIGYILITRRAYKERYF